MTDQQRAGEQEISFSAFVLSLATTAAVHFGDMADPDSGQRQPPNLQAAGQMIEILAMLQGKTRGNLSTDEQQLLDQLLYELRLRYVEAERNTGRIIQP